MGRDLTSRWNWTLLIWLQPGLEPVLSTGAHNCEDCLLGTGWGDWRVQPAAEAPEEPVEEWKAWRDASSWDDCSEENHPSEAYAQGCGRGCSAPGCPLRGTGPLLDGPGSVVGRLTGSLTVRPCERVAGGRSLEKRASPVWEG